LFTRFVDEQVRAIEDTKVKIKKRRGVIAFMKTFPLFSSTVENMLPSANDDAFARLEVRNMVDAAYAKVNKAMFESLKVIAKESPMLMAKEGMGDPEDKEALNYHILLIENMNHYVEEVDDRGDAVLTEWKRRAMDEMSEHMGLYVDAVIRRPLGKLLVS
jgi:exocyst complex component 1